MTQKDKWQKRESTDRYWKFCDEARLAATGNPKQKITENIFGVLVFAHFPIPKSWSKKKKELHYGRMAQAGSDADNILKGVMDALFEQDKTICVAQCYKFWCEEDAEPRSDVFLLTLPEGKPEPVPEADEEEDSEPNDITEDEE